LLRKETSCEPPAASTESVLNRTLRFVAAGLEHPIARQASRQDRIRDFRTYITYKIMVFPGRNQKRSRVSRPGSFGTVDKYYSAASWLT
jgi:hypothetical protein